MIRETRNTLLYYLDKLIQTLVCSRYLSIHYMIIEDTLLKTSVIVIFIQNNLMK